MTHKKENQSSKYYRILTDPSVWKKIPNNPDQVDTDKKRKILFSDFRRGSNKKQ